MPVGLRDQCIAIFNRKIKQPSYIYRTLIRGLIDDDEIFLLTAKHVREKYPFVDACQGIYCVEA